MVGRLSQLSYGVALVTLPMSGVGLLALLTGRDWGFGLQPSWVFLALAFFFLLLDNRPWSNGVDLAPLGGALKVLLISGMAVVGVVAISGLGIGLAPSGEPGPAAWGRLGRQTVQLIIMLGYVVWPALWTRGPARWRYTVKMLAAGALVQAAYGLVQLVHYYQPGFLLPALETIFTSNPAILAGSEELYLGDTFRHVPRLRGTVSEPLYLGNYLLLVIPWLAWGRSWVRYHRLALAVLILLLVLTWSRGAWLGFFIQLCFLGGMFLVRRQTNPEISFDGFFRHRVVLIGCGVLAVLLVAALFSSWPVFQLPRERLAQTFSSRDWSNLTRLYSMQAAWRAFLLSPIVGVGWGQYSFHFPYLVDPLGLQSQFTWPVVNNFPLKVLCETGVLGFLVFVVAGIRLAIAGARMALSGPRSPGALLALAAVLGVWTQLLTFSQYNLPHIWLAVGLLLAVIFDEDFPEPRPWPPMGPKP